MEEGERIIEGAPPLSYSPTHQYTSRQPNMVFVERSGNLHLVPASLQISCVIRMAESAGNVLANRRVTVII